MKIIVRIIIKGNFTKPHQAPVEIHFLSVRERNTEQ